MPLFSFEGRSPDVHPDAWVAPTATLVGAVTVEANASVWYGVVLRADYAPIHVGQGANIQDNTVVHGAGPVEIGAGATVAHLCVVHGAVIGREALIGNGATVQDGARVGDRALVAAGTLVPPNAVVAPGTLFRGLAGQPAGELTDGAAGWVRANPEEYRRLARRHAAGLQPVTP